ncbi:MAG: hypothetical protein ACT4OG_08480 [Alphaproteobacteria bacterium]
MFVLRAIFWLTVVALLMPREPNVGLGAPGALARAESADQYLPDCKDYQAACDAGLAMVDTFQTAALYGLSRIAAEIERQKSLREH